MSCHGLDDSAEPTFDNAERAPLKLTFGQVLYLEAMDEAIPIDEVVRRTGLTSRSLRFYESRGLLRPRRTSSDRRLFGPAELERVHQIMMLKRAGLTIAQMKQLFDRNSIDITSLLRAQLESLERQSAEIAAAQMTIRAVLDQVEDSQPLTVSKMCALIKYSAKCATHDHEWRAVIDRYWSSQAQSEWRRLTGPIWTQHPEWANGGYQRQWRALSDRIKAAMPMDPAGEQARGFVQEWHNLLAPINQVATPEMRAAMIAMYSDMQNWPTDVDHGFDQAVWDFVRSAHQAATDAGHSFDAGSTSPSSPQTGG